MKWIIRVALAIVVLIALPFVVYVATGISKTITVGEAYGFRIGDSRQATYEKAQGLKDKKKIVEIHTWPEGEYHQEISSKEKANKDPQWIMIIDSEWWNNSILLTFKDDRLVKIYRHRQLWEMP